MPIVPAANIPISDSNPSLGLVMARRIGRESITMLGGGRAILMQLAHPLVAAGVNEHSHFRKDPMTRLAQTMRLMLTIVFGDHDQVRNALRQFNTVHRNVRGSLREGQGRFPEGNSYTAQDPGLKLWVHATLIDTSLLVYDAFVAPLSTRERARFYEESKVIGGWLGIPASVFPATLHDFEEYMEEMVEGDTLAVTRLTRDLASDVLYPNAGLLPRSSLGIVRFATAGLLPPRLRRDYEFKWGPSQERLLEAMSKMYRLARPLAPKSIALMPQTGGGQLIQLALRQYGLEV
jgi:uncharacterized protein (DUF2236 family)